MGDADQARLIELRKRLGLTQAEMADAMGMSRRGYSDLENVPDKIRAIHMRAADAVSLEIAAKRQDSSLVSPTVMANFLALSHDTASAIALAEPHLMRAHAYAVQAGDDAVKEEALTAAYHAIRAGKIIRGEPL